MASVINLFGEQLFSICDNEKKVLVKSIKVPLRAYSTKIMTFHSEDYKKLPLSISLQNIICLWITNKLYLKGISLLNLEIYNFQPRITEYQTSMYYFLKFFQEKKADGGEKYSALLKMRFSTKRWEEGFSRSTFPNGKIRRPIKILQK